MKRIVLKEMLL